MAKRSRSPAGADLSHLDASLEGNLSCSPDSGEASSEGVPPRGSRIGDEYRRGVIEGLRSPMVGQATALGQKKVILALLLERTMTVPEACAAFNVTKQTLWRWIREDKVQVTSSRPYRISRDELVRFMVHGIEWWQGRTR